MWSHSSGLISPGLSVHPVRTVYCAWLWAGVPEAEVSDGTEAVSIRCEELQPSPRGTPQESFCLCDSDKLFQASLGFFVKLNFDFIK